MDSARSAIERMFAQEFCVAEAPPAAAPAQHADPGTPAEEVRLRARVRLGLGEGVG